MKNTYGTCLRCGCDLQPVWFIDEECKITNGYMYKTGRKRRAVDYLECPYCFKKECVDDSFDEEWR